MKIKIDVFGLKKWYKQLLDENFYKFLISLGLLASAPVIASVLFDYIVIYGNGRFKQVCCWASFCCCCSCY